MGGGKHNHYSLAETEIQRESQKDTEPAGAAVWGARFCSLLLPLETTPGILTWGYHRGFQGRMEEFGMAEGTQSFTNPLQGQL